MHVTIRTGYLDCSPKGLTVTSSADMLRSHVLEVGRLVKHPSAGTPKHRRQLGLGQNMEQIGVKLNHDWTNQDQMLGLFQEQRRTTLTTVVCLGCLARRFPHASPPGLQDQNFQSCLSFSVIMKESSTGPTPRLFVPLGCSPRSGSECLREKCIAEKRSHPELIM